MRLDSALVRDYGQNPSIDSCQRISVRSGNLVKAGTIKVYKVAILSFKQHCVTFWILAFLGGT